MAFPRSGGRHLPSVARIRNGSHGILVMIIGLPSFSALSAARSGQEQAREAEPVLFDGIFILSTKTKLNVGEIISRYRDL